METQGMNDNTRQPRAKSAPSAGRGGAIPDKDAEVGGGIECSWNVRIDDEVVYRNVGQIRGSWCGADGYRAAHVVPGCTTVGCFEDVAGRIVDVNVCGANLKRKAREGDVRSHPDSVGGIDGNGG